MHVWGIKNYSSTSMCLPLGLTGKDYIDEPRCGLRELGGTASAAVHCKAPPPSIAMLAGMACLQCVPRQHCAFRKFVDNAWVACSTRGCVRSCALRISLASGCYIRCRNDTGYMCTGRLRRQTWSLPEDAYLQMSSHPCDPKSSEGHSTCVFRQAACRS